MIADVNDVRPLRRIAKDAGKGKELVSVSRPFVSAATELRGWRQQPDLVAAREEAIAQEPGEPLHGMLAVRNIVADEQNLHVFGSRSFCVHAPPRAAVRR